MSTVKQVCEFLSISRFTIHRWMKEGMPYTRTGPHRVSLNVGDILSWLDSKGGTYSEYVGLKRGQLRNLPSAEKKSLRN